MLRKTTAVALLTLTGAALLPAASASALASVKTVTIHVVGIDRTGAQVGVASEVTAVHGNSQPGIGPAFHVKPGVYFISGDVRTAASGSTAASQTFVVRLVDVRTSRTIKLDSRGGRLVSVWLNGKDLGEPQDARVCVADGHGCGTSGMQESVAVPSSITVFRSPAAWSTNLDTFQGLQMCSYSQATTKETRGHSYTISLGDAARGPVEAVPVIDGRKLSFDPQWEFREPVNFGYAYCFKSTVTLRSGGHVLSSKQFSGQPFRLFTATAHAGRWYVLTADARQTAPRADLTGLLSPRTTLAWRFRFAKGAVGGVPVAVASLLPNGLDLNNRAAPGSTTSVRAFLTQGRYFVVPRPRVLVRSFTVQASFNDGKTWHGVGVVKHKGFWTFVVHNPPSGFVTLRTTTVSNGGNASTETIYRAYGIS